MDSEESLLQQERAMTKEVDVSYPRISCISDSEGLLCFAISFERRKFVKNKYLGSRFVMVDGFQKGYMGVGDRVTRRNKKDKRYFSWGFNSSHFSGLMRLLSNRLSICHIYELRLTCGRLKRIFITLRNIEELRIEGCQFKFKTEKLELNKEIKIKEIDIMALYTFDKTQITFGDKDCDICTTLLKLFASNPFRTHLNHLTLNVLKSPSDLPSFTQFCTTINLTHTEIQIYTLNCQSSTSLIPTSPSP
ncbi:unnamed protein product [Moneuplotes crassus]|uniref:Uncharacterized protein n=1 Tax=Euplotes crassus TaxID=5936 RepID=A0AAD1XQM7_EUPCR|nr:unnamed protein product [Moneuplotes crassus]